MPIGVGENNPEMLRQFRTKSSDFQKDSGTKPGKNHCIHCYRCLTIPFPRIRTNTEIQECFLFPRYRWINKMFVCPELTLALSGTDSDYSQQMTKNDPNF